MTTTKMATREIVQALDDIEHDARTRTGDMATLCDVACARRALAAGERGLALALLGARRDPLR